MRRKIKSSIKHEPCDIVTQSCSEYPCKRSSANRKKYQKALKNITVPSRRSRYLLFRGRQKRRMRMTRIKYTKLICRSTTRSTVKGTTLGRPVYGSGRRGRSSDGGSTRWKRTPYTDTIGYMSRLISREIVLWNWIRAFSAFLIVTHGFWRNVRTRYLWLQLLCGETFRTYVKISIWIQSRFKICIRIWIWIFSSYLMYVSARYF